MVSVLTQASSVLAQSPVCQRIELELAGLERGALNRDAGIEYVRLADRARADAARIAEQMRFAGCDRQQFPFFGGSPPLECRGLAQRLRQNEQLALQYDRAADQAQGVPAASERRRRELIAALDTYGCGSQVIERRPQRGVLESLFNDEPRARREIEIGPDLQEEMPGIDARPIGGSRAVCVRLCDGYFFPLDGMANRTRAEGDEVCRAVCPAAEAKLYFMAPGGEIQSAVSADGEAYTALTTALRYRKVFDQACNCRKPGQTWAMALQEAEALIDRQGDEIVVTPDNQQNFTKAPSAAARPPPPQRRR
jgi:hypothetical protein